MATAPPQVRPRRIVVALETRSLARSALDVAAGMAVRLQAELVGLVIEDVQLLRLAAMPFAREVGLVSASSRQLDVATMERAWRSLASDAERWLAAAAARAPMHWSLRVSRGVRIEQLVAAADQADLIVTGDAAVLLCSDEDQVARWEHEARTLLEHAGTPRPLRLLRAADRADLERLLRERH